ncbi:hypothetical protein [uncultured Alistipes sp.]|uniref:hypothetical protein n=1 Tax=uncultured Alistipes sp. TaxID=538949 RepID=UPI002729D8A6|nr:hypothetical protein [uncultured Alistipes sp.]
MKRIKLNQLDKRNLSVGLNAAVWPYLLFSPLGFLAGLTASVFCVILVYVVISLRDYRRYVGCDWRSYLLLPLPGLVYWTIAIALNELFG